MQKIGIFGLGAIGSLLTKYISQYSGNKYFYFNRSLKDAIKIKYQNKIDEFPITLSDNSVDKLDWIIICLKEYHHAEAIPQIKNLINQDTKLAIFQNGIYLSEKYTSFVKNENILETIIDCPIQRDRDDILIQYRLPKIVLPSNEISIEFSNLFNAEEIDIQLTGNFELMQWTKLIESSALGSIQAYTEQPCSIFEQEKYLNEFVELVEEGIRVAESEGISLPTDIKEELIEKLKAYPRTKGSSMLSDKLAGKKLELNAKIGIIKQIADRNGVYIPTTQRVFKLLVS